MAERYVASADGTWIAYEARGDGPALVLVHAGFADRSLVAPVVPLLARSFAVYSMDRRGHGASGPYTRDHNIEREYNDVAALIEHIGAPVLLVGHSSGARVALHAALNSPNVSRLVLYEPPLLPPSVPTEAVGRLYTHLEACDLQDVADVALLDVVAASERPGMSEEDRGQLRQRLRRSDVWAAALRNAESIPAEVESYFSYRFDPGEFQHFSVPTVLLLGGKSGPVMRRWVEDLSAALPVSTVMTLEGQGHAAMTAAPDLFVRTLLRALAWSPDS